MVRLKKSHNAANQFIKNNLAFYLIVLGLILVVRLFYLQADIAQLLFITKPLSVIVSLFYGTEFIFDADLGYISTKLGIAINKSCAGINFSLILFSMLSFSFIHLLKSAKRKFAYIMSLIPISYFFSLMVNAFRIIISIMIKEVPLLNNWVSSEVLHNLTGMLIFICFLLMINYCFSLLLRKERTKYEKIA